MNTSVLIGRLCAAPELRNTANGVSVCSFTLAVRRTKEITDFVDCVAWRERAEFVSKYFVKGQQMAVRGSIQTRSYTDKDGNKRKAVEVVVDEAQFVGSKPENNTEGSVDNFNALKDRIQESTEESEQYSGSDYSEVIDSELDLPF